MEATKNKKIDLDVVKSNMDDSYQLIYVNWQDNLNAHLDLFRKCLDQKSGEPLDDFFDMYYMDAESRAVDDVVDQIKATLIGNGYDREEVERFFEEQEDEIRNEIYDRRDNDGIEDMLKNTRDIPVRVEMYSNYDCINSHYFEGKGGFSYEDSYFGDMIDVLRLNPNKVKQMLVAHGDKVIGRFPDRKSRDCKEFVSYAQFFEEHINSSCGANLLTFMATLNPTELYESGFKLSKLTIPKGNKCGLFSSPQSGGSLLEMELLHDMTFDLEKREYPRYGFEIETDGDVGGYSIKQVYGVCDSVYGKSMSIHSKMG